VDREIDAPDKKRFLDFLGKQTFAAFFREWPILDGIAAGTNDDEFNFLLGHVHGRSQMRAHRACLHHGQWAAARTYAQRDCGLRHVTSRC
jgi:hypothetical protein